MHSIFAIGVRIHDLLGEIDEFDILGRQVLAGKVHACHRSSADSRTPGHAELSSVPPAAFIRMTGQPGSGILFGIGNEDMWAGLDAIGWSGLRHNYGTADGIPRLLRACASAEFDAAARAHDELENFLYHQGGWICPAAPAALPFLVWLAADAGVLVRPALIETIARLAQTGARALPRWIDPAWPAALRAVTPDLLGLLADGDPEVRHAATFLAGIGGLVPDQAVPALRARLEAEQDPAVRCDVIVALGAAAARSALMGTVHAELARLAHDEPDPQAGLAAIHGLASLGQPAGGQVGRMVAAITHPTVAGWRRSAWFGGPSVIVTATGNLLADDPAAAVSYATAVSGHGDGGQRVAAINHLGSVLEEWRVLPATVLSLLGGQLRAPEPDVRFRAAYLLAGIGQEARPFTDALAELTADASAVGSFGSRTAVSDAAVWALTRIGDPRGVPELGSRLAGSRIGFPAVNASFRRLVGRNALFIASLPSIGVVVTDADPGAGLLDLVIARLHKASGAGALDLAAILCETLGAWGAQAAPAVPQLHQILRESSPGRCPSQAAATALGRIGLASGEAADELRRHALAGSHDAAWALGRVTGDIREAVTTLIGMIRQPADNHVLRYLADFGTEAADAEEWLAEPLSSNPGDWQKVEAAHARWRITGDASAAISALAQAARPLADGAFLPVRLAAMKYLSAIPDPDPDGPAAAEVTATAQAVLANPRRLASHGGWRAFVEDDQVRAAAEACLSAQPHARS